MSNYPAGVTNATIDALYETEEDERYRERCEAWLAFDRQWWRRYLSADCPMRRSALLEARMDEAKGLPGSYDFLTVSDYAENLRSDTIRWESMKARMGVERSRRALADRAMRTHADVVAAAIDMLTGRAV